jgi:hypothetical protein
MNVFVRRQAPTEPLPSRQEAPRDERHSFDRQPTRDRLRNIRSQCRTCGVRFHGFHLGNDGVVQADRPVGCPELRQALRRSTLISE